MSRPSSRNVFTRFASGLRSILQGIRTTIASRDVRAAYAWIALSLMLSTIALQAAGVLVTLHFIPLPEGAHLSLSIGAWVLRSLALLVVLFLAPIVAITLCNIVAPIFSEIPFMAGMRAVDRGLAEELASRPGLPLALAIWLSLRRMSLFFCLVGVCLLIGLIPFVGMFIATPLQVYLAARTIGWEMLDPYFDKRALRLAAQRDVLKLYLPEVLGMGVICAPLLAIPLVGPLFFGVLQASAAKFVIDQLEPWDPQPADLNDSRLESVA